MLTPGQSLGSYELLRLLGEGGASQVFEAWDPAHQRLVAIKALRPEVYCLKPHVGLRFLDEPLQRRVPGFHHPGVLEIFETVWPPVGVPYHVMERMDHSLAARRGALSAAEVLRIGVQVAQALVALHQRGVLHGDVRSGHLLLRGDAAALEGKLVDFSLAEVGAGPIDGAADVRGLALALQEALGEQEPAGLGGVIERMRSAVPAAGEVVAALQGLQAR